MMKYELFKEVVAEKFKDYMPEQYKDMRVQVTSVTKVNRAMDGISLVGEGNQFVSPTMYINDMYDKYVASEDLQGVLENAAKAMVQAFEKTPVVPMLDFETAKDNIIFQLVNTMQNEELLKDAPHREFQDLSIIYRWLVDTDRDGIASSVIRNNLAEKLGVTEDQMFKLAVENTKRLLPPSIRNMNEVIMEMFVADGMPKEMVEMMIEDIPPEKAMYVISNDRGINGAISMLYEDGLHNLAEEIGTDLYILPSSVHEVLAVSTAMGDPEELAQMVNEINMGQVALEERLSNQVYHYDKDLRKLTLATDEERI